MDTQTNACGQCRTAYFRNTPPRAVCSLAMRCSVAPERRHRAGTKRCRGSLILGPRCGLQCGPMQKSSDTVEKMTRALRGTVVSDICAGSDMNQPHTAE